MADMVKILMVILFMGLLTSGCTQNAKTKRMADVEERHRASLSEIAGQDEQAKTYGIEEDISASISDLDDPQSLNSDRTIYFDYDSNIIHPDYYQIVEAHAGYLVSRPDVQVLIEGYTDERGTREYNLALGERRALAVRQQLVLLGAPIGQIQILSYGEERPAVEGHNEAAWVQNRRAEIVYHN